MVPECEGLALGLPFHWIIMRGTRKMINELPRENAPPPTRAVVDHNRQQVKSRGMHGVLNDYGARTVTMGVRLTQVVVHVGPADHTNYVKGAQDTTQVPRLPAHDSGQRHTTDQHGETVNQSGRTGDAAPSAPQCAKIGCPCWRGLSLQSCLSRRRRTSSRAVSVARNDLWW